MTTIALPVLCTGELKSRFSHSMAHNYVNGWLVDLIFNVPVKEFSVMLGQSHHFLGITSTIGE